MMASIFERPPPPPFVGPEALDNNQAARVAALFASAQAHPDMSVSEHVAMASYVMDGPGGYVGFWAAFLNEDENEDEDVVEVKDATGRTLFTSGPTRDPWAEPGPEGEERQ